MSSNLSPHALVLGATGVIGRYIVAELAKSGWKVSGMSRNSAGSSEIPGVRWLNADFFNAESLKHALSGIAPVTHVFYCAFINAPTWEQATAANAGMFQNVLDAMGAHEESLERFVLVTGTKYYGSHLGEVAVPLREHHPRHASNNFYYNQIDALSAAQEGRNWTWTELRPHTLCGFSPGTPMSLAMVLAVYGSICAELGEPMHFPGSNQSWRSLYQVTDSDLFSKAAKWAATEPRAANQAYNITNGEVFRWQCIWPTLARFFNVAPGEPRNTKLSELMKPHEALWQELVVRHGLQPYSLRELAQWEFGDYVFGIKWDIVSSVVKSRQHGFAEAVDSEVMFASLFKRLQQDRIIPPARL
jgi:nucleoside-diphosphate-sugar epimerase